MVVNLDKVRAADRRLCRRLDELARKYPKLVSRNLETASAAEGWLETLNEERMKYDTQLGIRVSEELIQRLDELAEKLEKATPGVGVTRTTAARVAIEAGLQLLHPVKRPWEKPKSSPAKTKRDR
jgi:predicted transcriptional regulator